MCWFDACNLLITQLTPIDEAEHEEWLEKIIDHVQKQTLTSPIIEHDQIQLGLQECIKTGALESETIFNVISAFEAPRFVYNAERNKFIKENTQTGEPQLFDLPKAKAALYSNRYTILLQRTQHHELFTPAVLGSSSKNRKFKLQSVEFLLSSSGKVKEVIILGMLTQLREGRYYIEDPTGTLQLDTSEASFHSGLYTENCFVLAEGFYEDKVFHAVGIGFPPPEETASSRAYFGNVNTFGGPSEISLRTSQELLRYEKENADGVLVFLADLWLDSLKVMERLRTLFLGFTDFPPVAFVFMGNFLSRQLGSAHATTLKSKFKALADLIAQFPELVQKSKFIFIPGPSDPASPNILPRFPLPNYITKEFQERIPSSIFTTNPCRIQYCTQEIVVVREDLVTKMCRNTIRFPTSGEIADHFAKTILYQSHLAPLPLSVCPVYWSFDPALQLYPLPDLVVVADQSNSFTTELVKCQVMNPGSFPKNEFSFKIYIPATRTIEDSQIPQEYKETQDSSNVSEGNETSVSK